jgi:hypothetical protein
MKKYVYQQNMDGHVIDYSITQVNTSEYRLRAVEGPREVADIKLFGDEATHAIEHNADFLVTIIDLDNQ